MAFLGFVIDPTKMTLNLTENKENKIFTICQEVIKFKVQSIRKIASLLGNIVASFETAARCPLWYRNIELYKIDALKAAKGNFEGKISLSPAAKIDVALWRDNIYISHRTLEERSITDVIYTDSSSYG